MLNKFIKESNFAIFNQKKYFFGIDSYEKCLDKNYFNNYSNFIDYNFNNFGFRDTNLQFEKGQIFTIGDSFTLGVGQPYEEIWPSLLENKINKKITKIAQDGASNIWILEVIKYLINFEPECIFVIFSFLHRQTIFYENYCNHIHHDSHLKFDDFYFFKEKLIEEIKNLEEICNAKNIKFLFSFVPFYNIKKYPDLENFVKNNNFICYKRLYKKKLSENNFYELKKIKDLARDGFHFGFNTSQEIANNFYKKYKKND